MAFSTWPEDWGLEGTYSAPILFKVLRHELSDSGNKSWSTVKLEGGWEVKLECDLCEEGLAYNLCYLVAARGPFNLP